MHQKLLHEVLHICEGVISCVVVIRKSTDVVDVVQSAVALAAVSAATRMRTLRGGGKDGDGILADNYFVGVIIFCCPSLL